MAGDWRRFSRRALVAILTIHALSLFADTAKLQPASSRDVAPILNEGGRGAIPGEYNVILKVGASSQFRVSARETAANLALARRQNRAAQDLVRRLGSEVHYSYDTASIGFSAKLSLAALDAVRRAPGIAYVEPEIRYSGDTIQAINPSYPKRGIDRIDRRLLPIDNTYTYSEDGDGVHVYVIDSGIRSRHADFESRAFGLQNFYPDAAGNIVPDNTDDCHGHGTHVAGIIGGRLVGVAKKAKLFALRVFGCSNLDTTPGAVNAAIDAAALHAQQNPNNRAVVNMSLSGLGASTAQRDKIINAMANQNLVFVVSAGNASDNACNYMPASMTEVITVGAASVGNPNDSNSRDLRDPTSNVGSCLDLFAPGSDILSTFIPDADDPVCSVTPADPSCFNKAREASGTSQAAPHVAGVAARVLQVHPTYTQAQIWNAIHAANNVAGSFVVLGGAMKVWPGIIEPATNAVISGSPNEMLHYGSVGDGYYDGDPHVTTVDGVRYDFQGAGEFVLLKESNGFEIQSRTRPVATALTPLADPYTGLANCVSVNTAVAARVGKHRVTFQPNLSRRFDPGAMEVRVDGNVVGISMLGTDLKSGGRITRLPGGVIDVQFPDGTEMLVTPGWWAAHQTLYLNLAVLRTTATSGVMGAIPNGSWLPAFPDGTSLGAMPASLQQRHVDLNGKFADAWRVDAASSLFDYRPGESTATFTRRDWPSAEGQCALPGVTPARPVPMAAAQRACNAIADPGRRSSCVFDVAVTGEVGFAKAYLLTERTLRRSTRVSLYDDTGVTAAGQAASVTALVERRSGGRVPKGTIRFLVDGKPASDFVGVDARGHATWRTSRLAPGVHKITAMYIPKGPDLLPSRSLEVVHEVQGAAGLR
jgi:subtilisin family serine protease